LAAWSQRAGGVTQAAVQQSSFSTEKSSSFLKKSTKKLWRVQGVPSAGRQSAIDDTP